MAAQRLSKNCFMNIHFNSAQQRIFALKRMADSYLPGFLASRSTMISAAGTTLGVAAYILKESLKQGQLEKVPFAKLLSEAPHGNMNVVLASSAF